MGKFRIRFNKTAGQPNRGTIDHKWRVFDENGKEYICKKVVIGTPSYTESDPNGNDWNLCTIATMTINREESVIIFN